MNMGNQGDQYVAQLIDANLDRAREGLRVVEDWCRFGLKDLALSAQLKDLRQKLGSLHERKYKYARNTSTDKGLGLDHPCQLDRNSPDKIIEANCSRSQEALRVLEEFSRKRNDCLAKTAKDIRYELYDLEIKILNATDKNKRHKILNSCNLCLVTSPKKNLLPIIDKVLRAGVKMIQYRYKEGNDIDKIKEASDISSKCKEFGSLLIINDRIDIALAVDADGVHLGQNDFTTKLARKLLGSEKIIGRSTNCLEQVNRAYSEGCDYIGFGPIYQTATKPNKEAIGIDKINKINSDNVLPFFCIGGINNTNIEPVISAGASRIAVISAIMEAKDPYLEALEFLKKLK